MSKSPATRASLVIRLKDSHDDIAWGEFVEVYAPLIHAFGLKNRMQDADAADLAQDVLQAVAANAGRFDYDPRRGSFRGWLFTITRNKLRTRMGRDRRVDKPRGGTEVQQLLNEQPGDPDDESTWNAEHQKRLFDWAANRVRKEFQPATWDAFWKTAVEDKPATDVANELAISVGAVYIAKSRVLARLRDEIKLVEDDES